MQLFIGNALVAIGVIFLIPSMITNDKTKVFIYQGINTFFCMLSCIVLGGWGGAITNLIAVVRNVIQVKERMTMRLQWGLTILLFVVGSIINKEGVVGYIPVAASIIYTLLAYRENSSIVQIKLAIVINLICWTIYDIIILAYMGALVDGICIIATVVSIFLGKKKKQAYNFVKIQ